MKPREPRRKVMIRARLRCGTAWHDACILDISPRGLLLQLASPPPRGSYLEIRRGRHVIVCRVAWAKGHRAGLRSQDVLAVDAIIAEPGESGDTPAEPLPIERRAAPRSPEARHDQSRLKARAFEFAWIGAFGIAGCVLAFGAVEQLFARPMQAVEQALTPQ